jgi:hypothetical protein
MFSSRCSSPTVAFIGFLIPFVSASTTFKPNCTTPTEGANLILSPDIRGTFTILWSSVFTLLVCSWTVQHLNVPLQTIEQKGFLPTVERYAMKFWRKVKWMLLTLLTPEFLIGKARQDYVRAKASINEMSQIAIDSGFSWTVTHGFYADMGGFVLKARQRRGGQTVQTPVYLNCQSLRFACQGTPTAAPLMSRLPTIAKKEIEDKSKGDFFVKAIAVIQVSWMFIQTVARGARGLAVSQLELSVLGYSACTIITYFLCWSKPQDVQVPTVLRVDQEYGEKKLSDEHLAQIQNYTPRSWFHISLRLFRLGRRDYRTDVLRPIANDARYDDVKSIFFSGASLTRMDDGFLVAGFVFGSVHCAAWDFDFPTPTEQLLWRVSSLITAGILPFYYFVLLYDIHVKWPGFIHSLVVPPFEVVLALAYILARFYLIVEIFRSLCFLPPSAFLTTWSTEIPNVS